MFLLMLLNTDDVFLLDALSEGDDGSSLMTDDRSAVIIPLVRISKTVLALDSKCLELSRTLIDEINAWLVATAKAEKKVERQEGLDSVYKQSKFNALKDFVILRGRGLIAGTCEA